MLTPISNSIRVQMQGVKLAPMALAFRINHETLHFYVAVKAHCKFGYMLSSLFYGSKSPASHSRSGGWPRTRTRVPSIPSFCPARLPSWWGFRIKANFTWKCRAPIFQCRGFNLTSWSLLYTHMAPETHNAGHLCTHNLSNRMYNFEMAKSVIFSCYCRGGKKKKD